MKYLLLIVLFCSIGAYAQPDDGEVDAPLQQQNLNTAENLKTKLGVKFTMGGHTFLGDAFDNPKLLYGFGAGMYNIIHLNEKKTTHLQWELNINFKGSKFAKPNDTSYSKISLAYLELPVYFSIQLFNPKSNQPLHLLLGGQFGYLFRSTINKSYGKFGEVKTNLPFKTIDISPAIGIRKEIGNGMAIQLCGKMGLNNIYTNTFYERSQPSYTPVNNNDDYRDLTPTLKDGTHKTRNFSLEFSFLF